MSSYKERNNIVKVDDGNKIVKHAIKLSDENQSLAKSYNILCSRFAITEAYIQELISDSRLKSIALTKLEEAFMYAIKAFEHENSSVSFDFTKEARDSLNE